MRTLYTRSRNDKQHKQPTKLTTLPVLITVAVLAASFLAAPLVQADAYDDKINALRQQNAASRQEQGQLAEEAATLESKIAAIRAEIAELERQIAENTARRNELTARIAAAELELANERTVLGQNIKRMYMENNMTTVEMLATSNDLSHFVDKQQYREALQNRIQETMRRIAELQKQLEEQKAQTERLLLDQQSMQGQLGERRAESERLLRLNKQEQASFNTQIKENNTRIAELKRQQAAENAKNFIGPVRTVASGSAYPWAGAPFPNSIPDPWGMYKRQCVSYTAWKVASSGRHMPYWGGRGNAKLWDDNARAAGIPVDSTPRVGDVAVSNSGTYGHVMYVEAVHGDGTISISQYNAGWKGEYSEGRRTTAGLVFIHF